MVSTRRKKATETEPESTPTPPPTRTRRSRAAKEKSATPNSRLKSKTPSIEEPEEVKSCTELVKDIELDQCDFFVVEKTKENEETIKVEDVKETFDEIKEETVIENVEQDIDSSELKTEVKEEDILEKVSQEKNSEIIDEKTEESDAPSEGKRSKSPSPMDISDNEHEEDKSEENINVPSNEPESIPEEPEFIEIEQPKYRRPHIFHPAAAAFEEEKEVVKIPKPVVSEDQQSMGIKPIVIKTPTRPGLNPNPLLFSPGKRFGATLSATVPPISVVELPKPSFFGVKNVPPPQVILSPEPEPSSLLSGPMIIAPAVDRRKEEEKAKESARQQALAVAAKISRKFESDERPKHSLEREREKNSRDERYRESNTSSYHRSSHREDFERRGRERDRRHSHNHHSSSRRYESNNDREKRKDERDKSSPRKDREFRIEKEDDKKERKYQEDHENNEKEQNGIEEIVKNEEKYENEREKEHEEEIKEKTVEKIVAERAKSPEIPENERKIPHFEPITECKYLTKNASKKKTESLVCECHESGNNCSDDDCVNRAMYTECPTGCPATKCKNQRFTKKKNAAVEPFNTGTKKGCGLRATKDIKKGQFIIEYVGEMLERDDYAKRKEKYAKDKSHKHHYFCDTGSHTIDATTMGNPSRFINHSCNPNAVCEKWMVPKTPGAVNRIGFFAKRAILAGEEITFDYQFVNYGREAQQCFCGSENCTGYIGERPEDFSSDEEDESDDELITTEELDDEEKRISELEFLSENERKEAIENLLADLVVRNRKYSKKVIQIAERMTNCEQRMKLIDEIFSQDTTPNTQSHYAKEGILNLMYEWLSQQDLSIENLKLMQKVLQTLHGEVFVPFARSDKDLLEVVDKIAKSEAAPEGIHIQSVVDSLVISVETGEDYNKIEDLTYNEINANFVRLREMAIRLNGHWWTRSVTFRIPKKQKVEPVITPKQVSKEHIQSIDNSYESKYYSSQPKFFDSRSEYGSTIGGRYGGYRSFGGNNGEFYRGRGEGRRYPAHQYDSGTTSFFNQFPSSSYRKRARYSRSRSRSLSPPPNNKRFRNDDRKSPIDTTKKPTTPPFEPDRCTSSVSSTKSEIAPKLNNVPTNPSVRMAPPGGPPPPPIRMPPPPPHYDYQMGYGYPYPYFPRGPPTSHPIGYPPHPPGFPQHPSYWPTEERPRTPFRMETLPTIEDLRILYKTATIEQIREHRDELQLQIQLAYAMIAQKEVEMINVPSSAAIIPSVNMIQPNPCPLEGVHEPPPKKEKYSWARAKSENGETYYYNKITKETQWDPPNPEQGEVDPNDQTPPDTTEESDNKSSLQARLGELIESDSAESIKMREREEREREIARQRCEAAKLRQNEENERMQKKTRDFKIKLEQVVAPIVKPATKNLKSATPEKVMWLVKTIVREMFKRQTSEGGFNFELTDSAKVKVKKYTAEVLDRKLKNGGIDFWKGYQSRQ
ncbi:unnamed protein product [Caenorhabditis angaria]|uniref:Histone-lysine N-methyltransferase n=1 Tax=Caenorhabditis angaria TaxID=860376 RepID=A0A9P1MT13_9PELO|nr:unnamed protein product [Caenorhabditis angaria]